MKREFHLLAACCLILLPCTSVFAQPAAVTGTDTTLKPVSVFYSSVNQSSHLFNGTEYIMYDQHIKGDPYYVPGMQPGSVFYDGTLYKNVPMLYELTTGNLVIRPLDENHEGVPICLIAEKVGYFSIDNHTFVHIVPDSGNNIISNGFYDHIYNGSISLFVKRQKLLFEDPTTYDRSFVTNDKFFVFRNNTWYAIHSQGDLMEFMKERKKDVAKYLRQNKIKYKKTPEYAMVKMAEYYDTLTH